jgi:uncharacterized spore protein YtfJ
MEVSELLDKTRGDISARRVFGEAIQQGDSIVIPAAKVRGGGGEERARGRQSSRAERGAASDSRPGPRVRSSSARASSAGDPPWM